MEQVEKHNARYREGKETYFKGLNQFSDLTQKEFTEAYLMKEVPQFTTSDFFHLSEKVAVPNFVDWTEKGVVLPVRDQLICGSCWAFSAVSIRNIPTFSYIKKICRKVPEITNKWSGFKQFLWCAGKFNRLTDNCGNLFHFNSYSIKNLSELFTNRMVP